MPKVKKNRKSNRLNGKKGGRPKSKNDEISDVSDDNDSDEDFFYGTQPRGVDNSNSMCFMKLKMNRRVDSKRQLKNRFPIEEKDSYFTVFQKFTVF